MRYLLPCLAVLLSGCATVTPQPVSADRAAGTVTFVADRTRAHWGEVDWSAVTPEAIRRCRAWGYETAEPLAVLCRSRVIGGKCIDRMIAREYQCSG